MSSEDGEPPATTLPLDKSKEGLTKASEKYSKARTVAEEIVGQWAWVDDMNKTMSSMLPLRNYVSTYREAAWRASSNIQAVTREVQHQWDTMMEPSETTQRYWAAALNFRRKYPGLLVAGATGVSVVPALIHFRESRLTAARLLVRNSIIGGGAAAVLLYPELIFRTAPYISRGVNKANEMVASAQASASRRGGQNDA